jgi:hypothetical protein
MQVDASRGYRDAPAAIDWLKAAFDSREPVVPAGENEALIAGLLLRLAEQDDASPARPHRGPGKPLRKRAKSVREPPRACARNGVRNESVGERTDAAS